MFGVEVGGGGGQACERAQEAGDREWKARRREGENQPEGEEGRGVKGRDPDTCSYLNLQLLAEVTAERLRREALYCSGL